MTLIKMSYICGSSKFKLIGLNLIWGNFVSIIGVYICDHNKIHSLFHFLFFYLILVILILSFKKKYSIDKRHLFSMILFISIIGFNVLVIANNVYLLYHSNHADIMSIKKDSQWYLYMIFLNICIPEV